MTHDRTSELSRAEDQGLPRALRPAVENMHGADLDRRAAQTNVSLAFYRVKKIKIAKQYFVAI
ncbi:hypothetical protein ACSDR0_23235 [Streptosporangium sp. G11]|uniref:hypothetical protein n=1 Tax=Streptosporangium sp. G11 TaxID=3436926 RepID=UPI003EBB7201